MTRHWWIMSAALAALTVAAASTAGAAKATGSGEIKALAAHLKIDAENWIKGDLSQHDFRTTALKLKKITYDTRNVSVLVPLIRGVTGASKPQDIFVANRLIRPLLMAKRDVVRKALPTVKQIHHSGRYKPMPQHLRKVRKMTVPGGKVSSDAVVAAIAASQMDTERRQRARAITLWNEEFHTLKLMLYELLIFAEDGKEDRELLNMLQAGESAGLYAFLDICEIVKRHVRTLDRTRAQAYHKAFASLGARLRAKKGRYVKHFEYKGNLRPASKDAYAGILLLKTANLLAPVARRSAVVVPTEKQVNEYNKRR